MLQLLDRILSELLRRLVGTIIYVVLMLVVLWGAVTYTIPRVQANIRQMGTALFAVPATAPQQVPTAAYRR